MQRSCMLLNSKHLSSHYWFLTHITRMSWRTSYRVGKCKGGAIMITFNTISTHCKGDTHTLLSRTWTTRRDAAVHQLRQNFSHCGSVSALAPSDPGSKYSATNSTKTRLSCDKTLEMNVVNHRDAKGKNGSRTSTTAWDADKTCACDSVPAHATVFYAVLAFRFLLLGLFKPYSLV